MYNKPQNILHSHISQKAVKRIHERTHTLHIQRAPLIPIQFKKYSYTLHSSIVSCTGDLSDPHHRIIMKQCCRPTNYCHPRVAPMLLFAIVLLPSLLLSRCSADESSNLRRTATIATDYDAAASSPVGKYSSQNYMEEGKLHPFSSFASERRDLVSFKDCFVFFFTASLLFCVFSNHRRRVM